MSLIRHIALLCACLLTATGSLFSQSRTVTYNAADGKIASPITLLDLTSVTSVIFPADVTRLGNSINLSSEVTGSLPAASVTWTQTGTGAVARTQDARNKDWVSVKDFGALGDGATDDTIAINRAAISISTTGGTLYFPKGIYIVRQLTESGIITWAEEGPRPCILLYSGMTVRGDGMDATRIKLADSADTSPPMLLATEAQDIIVRDLTIDGNDDRVTEHTPIENEGLNFKKDCRQVTVENVRFTKMYDEGIDIDNVDWDLDGYQFFVRNCRFEDVGGSGIHNANWIVVENCYFDTVAHERYARVPAVGSEGQAAIDTAGEQLYVSGCYFNNCVRALHDYRNTSTADTKGIHFTHSYITGSEPAVYTLTVNSSRDCVIDSVYIDETTDIGLIVMDTTSTNFSIVNSTFIVNSASTIKNVLFTVAKGTFAGNTVSGGYVEIRADDCVIANNYMTSPVQCIYLNGGTLKDILIAGNNCTGASGTTPIECATSGQTNIAIIGNNVTSGNNGIRVQASSVVSGNVVRSAIFNGIVLAGTGNMCVGNSISGSGSSDISNTGGSNAVIANGSSIANTFLSGITAPTLAATTTVSAASATLGVGGTTTPSVNNGGNEGINVTASTLEFVTEGTVRFTLTNAGTFTGGVYVTSSRYDSTASGSAGSPLYGFNSLDAGLGMFRNGSANLGFSTGSTLRWNLNSTGGQLTGALDVSGVIEAGASNTTITTAAGLLIGAVVDIAGTADETSVALDDTLLIRDTSGSDNNEATVGNILASTALFSQLTSVGNVGAGEDTLLTGAVAANTLSVNGQAVHVILGGTVAASATPTIKLKFGGTTVLDTGALASNGGLTDWRAEVLIVRTGAATQRCIVTLTRAGIATFTDYTTAAETLSGSVNFVVTGEGASDNDATLDIAKGTFVP